MAEVGNAPGVTAADLVTLVPPIVASTIASSAASRMLYTSSGTVTVGNNSSARSTMLPAGLGASTLVIPANAMPIGAELFVRGSGIISASTVGSPTFTFTPHITPAGGSKTDLVGRSVAPLIGVVGICYILMTIKQTAAGLVPGGWILYAADNTNNIYPVAINPSRTPVASDPSIARTLGIDGQWSAAAAANYVTPQDVSITLNVPGA